MLYRADGEGIMTTFTSTVEEDRNWLYLAKYSYKYALKNDIPKDLMSDLQKYQKLMNVLKIEELKDKSR